MMHSFPRRDDCYVRATTSHTFQLYGLHNGAHQHSCLDPVYTAGAVTEVRVKDTSISDNRPVIAVIKIDGVLHAACGDQEAKF